MISLSDELERIRNRYSEDIQSPAPAIVLDVAVESEISAEVLINRVCSVLAVVIEYSTIHNSHEIVDDGHFDESYWQNALPDWFTQCTPFERSFRDNNISSSEKWSVESWLYWFVDVQSERSWRWWGASILTDSKCVIRIQTHDYPVAWAALKWLILSSGASSAELVRP